MSFSGVYTCCLYPCSRLPGASLRPMIPLANGYRKVSAAFSESSRGFHLLARTSWDVTCCQT